MPMRSKYVISDDNKISEVEENSNVSRHYISTSIMNTYNEKIYESKSSQPISYKPAIVDIYRPEDGATIYRPTGYNNPLETLNSLVGLSQDSPKNPYQEMIEAEEKFIVDHRKFIEKQKVEELAKYILKKDLETKTRNLQNRICKVILPITQFSKTTKPTLDNEALAQRPKFNTIHSTLSLSRNGSRPYELKTIMTPIKSSTISKVSRNESRDTGRTYTLINAGAMMISPKLKTCIKNPESSTSQYQLYDIPAPSLSNELFTPGRQTESSLKRVQFSRDTKNHKSHKSVRNIRRVIRNEQPKLLTERKEIIKIDYPQMPNEIKNYMDKFKTNQKYYKKQKPVKIWDPPLITSFSKGPADNIYQNMGSNFYNKLVITNKINKFNVTRGKSSQGAKKQES